MRSTNREGERITHFSLQLYPAYKPSGVEWLGDVPTHWEVRRLKVHVADIIDQSNGRRQDEVCIALEHVESWTGKIRDPGLDVGLDSQVKRFQAGDVLFGKLRPYLAKVSRPDYDGLCVGEFLVLRPRDSALSSSYLEHVLRSKPTIDAINGSTFGAKMPRADWNFIGGMEQPLPPLPEQIAIVRYLDYADERIRRYVSGKQKLIRLLEEEKQAVIHRAVTRGIDPNVRLKPSGVEWMGDVPAHWEVCRTKHLFRLRTEKSGIAHRQELLSIYTHIGVRPRKDLEEKGNKASTTDDYWIVKKGDIIANKLLAWMGAIGVSHYEGVTSPAYDILMPVIDLSSDYYHHLFRTKLYLQQFKQRSRGIMDMRLRLYFDQFGQIPIPVPPVDEQQVIVDYYNNVTSKTDDYINQARRQIELLQEYRTRLIADVVTGKLDVRGAVANLSDEVNAPESPETVGEPHRRACV